MCKRQALRRRGWLGRTISGAFASAWQVPVPGDGALPLLCAPGWCRGCAQVGIIRALTECGIPVDMVGGTSIGAFMGALYSEERNYSQIRIRAKQWAEVRGLCPPGSSAPGSCGAAGAGRHWDLGPLLTALWGSGLRAGFVGWGGMRCTEQVRTSKLGVWFWLASGLNL